MGYLVASQRAHLFACTHRKLDKDMPSRIIINHHVYYLFVFHVIQIRAMQMRNTTKKKINNLTVKDPQFLRSISDTFRARTWGSFGACQVNQHIPNVKTIITIDIRRKRLLALLLTSVFQKHLFS